MILILDYGWFGRFGCLFFSLKHVGWIIQRCWSWSRWPQEFLPRLRKNQVLGQAVADSLTGSIFWNDPSPIRWGKGRFWWILALMFGRDLVFLLFCMSFCHVTLHWYMKQLPTNTGPRCFPLQDWHVLSRSVSKAWEFGCSAFLWQRRHWLRGGRYVLAGWGRKSMENTIGTYENLVVSKCERVLFPL